MKDRFVRLTVIKNKYNTKILNTVQFSKYIGRFF